MVLLVLATAAIMCPKTNQSVEFFLYSSQHYMLQGQNDAAMVWPQGTKLMALSLWQCGQIESGKAESGQGAHHTLGRLLIGCTASKSRCRETVCLGVSQQYSFFKGEGAPFTFTWYQKVCDRLHHLQASVFLIFLCMYMYFRLMGCFRQ